MSVWALLVTALAVGADAFVVALGRGACRRTLDLRAVAGNAVAAPTGSWCARVVLAMGVATSLDALAVGVGLALVEVDILLAVLLIGTIASVLSCAGVVIGQRAGQRHRRAAGLLGGGILVALGVRILADGLRLG